MSQRKPKRHATKRASRVYVVIHCEYFPTSEAPCTSPRMDEMVFHVASSLRTAERYVKDCWVAPYSWWQIEQRVIDEKDSDADDRPVRTFYNHRGVPRKSPPHAAARRAFDKWQAEEAAADRRSGRRDSRT